MRPDEHKKKRSTQYKKKHGINEKTVPGKSGDHVHGRSGGKQGEKDEGEKKEPISSRQDENVPSREDINPFKQVSEGRPSFSRRKVESNWSRYEDTSLNENDFSATQLRGEDFRALLGVTSDSFSQFRFQEEKEWETEADASSQVDAAFLAIDTVDLASAMQCIPLHRRLDIEESIFGDELIESFHQEAKEHLLHFQSKKALINTEENPVVSEDSVCMNPEEMVMTNRKMTSPVPTHNSGDDSDGLLDDILDMTEDIQIPSGKESIQCNSHSGDNISKKPVLEGTSQINSASICPTVQTTEFTKEQSEQNNLTVSAPIESDNEEDLDILLGIGDVTLKQDTATISTKEKHPVQTAEEKHATTDTLSTAEQTLKPKTCEVKQPSTSLADNLDDWLDSVLED